MHISSHHLVLSAPKPHNLNFGDQSQSLAISQLRQGIATYFYRAGGWGFEESLRSPRRLLDLSGVPEEQQEKNPDEPEQREIFFSRRPNCSEPRLASRLTLPRLETTLREATEPAQQHSLQLLATHFPHGSPFYPNKVGKGQSEPYLSKPCFSASLCCDAWRPLGASSTKPA